MNTIIMMKDNVKNLTDLNDFMKGNNDLGFYFTCKKDSYAWIESVLGRFDYFGFGKKQKGILKKYLIKMTGYTDRHIKRLIKRYGLFGSLPTVDVRRIVSRIGISRITRMGFSLINSNPLL